MKNSPWTTNKYLYFVVSGHIYIVLFMESIQYDYTIHYIFLFVSCFAFLGWLKMFWRCG